MELDTGVSAEQARQLVNLLYGEYEDRMQILEISYLRDFATSRIYDSVGYKVH